MSSYILCQTRRARVPFYIENISTNIYSLEELCYYLYHNLYLVDQTLVNNRLCLWVENELWLPALAAKLRQHLGKFSDLSDILYPVFKEINYLTYEELKELNVRLHRMDQQTLEEKDKEKGDSLMENGMYVQAIHTYQKVLDRYLSDPEEMKEEEILFRTRVLHNLGCAFANLFQMEKSCECFWEAYEFSGRQEELLTYLLAYRSIRTPEDYQNRLKELGLTDLLKDKLRERLNRFTEIPEETLSPEDMDSAINRITREYHRSTGS